MFVFLPMAFASFMGRVRNSSINITATSSQKYNCVVPESNHTSPTECSQKFGGGGDLKIQSFKTSQGVVSQPHPTPPQTFHGREMDNSCNEILH